MNPSMCLPHDCTLQKRFSSQAKECHPLAEGGSHTSGDATLEQGDSSTYQDVYHVACLSCSRASRRRRRCRWQ